MRQPSKKRLRAATLAVCEVAGFKYDGDDILESRNPRSWEWQLIATAVIKALDAIKKKENP